MNNLSKLILGTVQFGLDYGINNSSGKVPAKEVTQILDYAKSVGINTLDTAVAYGNAEEKIGGYHLNNNPFIVNTKFDKRNDIDWEDSLRNSLTKLKIPKVNTVMFHSFGAYYQQKENLPNIISKGKGNYFNNIGISVYTNEELKLLLNDQYIEVIQLPFNLLDNERLRGKFLKQLKEKGKTIHVRSVFLQGLFYKNTDGLSQRLPALIPFLTMLQKITHAENISMNALALQYAYSKEYIDGILIGVDSKLQLEENVYALNQKIDMKLFSEIDKIKVSNTDLLNPAKW